MSNKLTKDKLDLLIEQVLSEDFEYDIKDKDEFMKNKYVKNPTVSATGKADLEQNVSSHKAVKDIAKLQPEADELTDEDFDYIMQNIENPKIFTTTLMKQLIALKYSTKDSQIKQKVKAIFDKRDDLVQKKSKDRQSITQPRFRPITAEEGQYTGDIALILNKILPSAGTKIKGRVEKVSEISKMFYKAAGGDSTSIQKIKNLDPQTFLSYVMLMDYFVEIGKSFDSGSGAYLFEWFLAMLSGGRVLGKATGPGGGMGAVDFEGGPGVGSGSAKYYATKSDIKQAASGFNKGELVQYIVGLKKQHFEQIGKVSRGSSDPSKITMVDIYTPKVKKVSDTEFKINKETVTISSAKSDVPIGSYLGERLATIYIAEVQTKSFREMVYRSVSTSLNNMKEELLKTFEGFFQQLEAADEACRMYAAGGKLDDANKTIVAIDQSKDQFEELIPKINDKLNYDDSANQAVVKENEKKSLKDLDKLIERVILNKMNK